MISLFVFAISAISSVFSLQIFPFEIQSILTRSKQKQTLLKYSCLYSRVSCFRRNQSQFPIKVVFVLTAVKLLLGINNKMLFTHKNTKL